MDIVEAEEVTKIYKTFYGKVTALNRVSLNIGRGVTGILGPNGSGKTTLIKMISGIIRPTIGEINVLGGSPLKASVKKKIAYLPEKPVFPKSVTVKELTKYISQAKGIPEEELLDALYNFEIFDVSRKVGALSAGMTQKIGLAYALTSSQDVIILDEPTANLDPIWRKKVLNMIKKKSKDSTVLFSSHILHDIENVADNIVILYNSHLILQDSMENILKKYGGARYKITLKDGKEIYTDSLKNYVSENVENIIVRHFELDDLFGVIVDERANKMESESSV